MLGIGGQGNSVSNQETLQDQLTATINAGGIYAPFDPAPRSRSGFSVSPELLLLGVAGVLAVTLFALKR